MADDVVGMAAQKGDESAAEVDRQGNRVQLFRPPDLVFGVVESPLSRQQEQAVPVMERGVALIELKCPMKLAFRASVVPVEDRKHRRKRRVCFDELIVDLHRP